MDALSPSFLGMVLPSSRDQYARAMVRGASATANERGFRFVCYKAPLRFEFERELLTSWLPFRPQELAGIILPYACPKLIAWAVRLQESVHIPAVLVARQAPGLASVLADDAASVACAVERLAAAGHTRIAYLNGPASTHVALERLRGYRDGLIRCTIAEDPRLIVDTDFTTSGGSAAMQRLLDSGTPFTAVIASNDWSALGALHALRGANRRVPEDVAVIGYDNVVESNWMLPPLTTIAVPAFAMGCEAARLALAPETRQAAPCSRIPCALVVRESCGTSTSPSLPDEPTAALATALAAAGLEADPHATAATAQQLLTASQSLRHDRGLTLRDTLAATLRLGVHPLAANRIVSLLRSFALPPAASHPEAPFLADLFDQLRLWLAATAARHGYSDAALEAQTQEHWMLLHHQGELLLDEDHATARFLQILARHQSPFVAWLDLPSREGIDGPARLRLWRQPQFEIHSAAERHFDVGAVQLTEWLPPEASQVVIYALQGPTGEQPLAFLAACYRDPRLGNSPILIDQLSYVVSSARIFRRLETNSRELDAARRLAEQASDAKSRFLANMSHELRTPLNAILGFSELALSTELSSEQHQFIGQVFESARLLLGLVDDLLDFSKIEAGHPSWALAAFETRTILAGATQNLAVQAERQGVDLFVRLAPDVPCHLMGLPGHLNRVLINLISNAVKFTQNGSIRVDVALAEKLSSDPAAVELVVAVSDSGIGIASDQLAHIFEPFAQADSSPTRKTSGVGLGLAICRSLVQQMGGTIRATSSPGEGSTFTFTARFQRPAAPPASLRLPDLAQFRILATHGDAHVAAFLTRILRDTGAHVDTATQQWQALQLAIRAADMEQPFHALVTDLTLPDSDGWCLAERLAQIQNAEILTLLLCPASRAHREVMTPFRIPIAKPILSWHLLDCLARTLRAPGFEPPPAASELVRPLSSLAGARRGRLLVAEDDPVNRMLAIALLERKGFEVKGVHNGHKVIEAIERHAYDAILMDVDMPGMDGWECASVIRQRERASGRHIPIIAVTAHAFAEDRERCLNAGMDGYITKPLDADQLVSLIDTHLQ